MIPSNLRLQLLFRLVAVVVAVGSSVGFAQEATLRPYLDSRGPIGAIYGLAFSRDSRKLLAAGSDKSLHVWEVGWDAGEAAERSTYVGNIRWQIARGPRGEIRTLAVCPTRDEVAIGGVAAVTTNGDLGIGDLRTRQLLTALPSPAKRAEDIQRSGHTSGVESVAYSPSGNRLVSVCRDSRFFLWSRDPQTSLWTGRELMVGGKTAFKRDARVMFVSESDVVLGIRSGQENSDRLRIVNVDRVSVRDLPDRFYGGGIAAMARSRDDWFAIASDDGKVDVWEGHPGTSDPKKINVDSETITGLSLAEGGVLVVSSLFRSPDSERSTCQLWDCGTMTQLGQQSYPGRSIAALSGDGRRLAIVTVGERNQMRLFRLRDGVGPISRDPFIGQTAKVLENRGLVASDLRFTTGGKVAIYRRSQDQASAAEIATFDPGKAQVVFGDNSGPKVPPAPSQLQGWLIRIARSITNPEQSTVVLERGVNKIPVVLHPWQGKASASVWIPALDGSTPGFVLGTDNGGVYVYVFSPEQGGFSLQRWFRDHQEEITALTVSPENQMLVSASRDQTIKVWSLRNLFARDPEFSGRSAWGARFSLQAGNVVVTELDPGGIAAARGLRQGSVITEVMGYFSPDDQVPVVRRTSDHGAAAVQEALARFSLLSESLVVWEDRGVANQRVIRPAWEPLLTAFVASDSNWVVWHPSGYFNASAAEGGKLLGWQINQGQDRPPRLLTADAAQKEFERPDVLQQLMEGVEIEQALQRIGKAAGPASAEAIARQVPEVQILSPTAVDQFAADAEIEIQASVKVPDPDLRRYRISAAINGVRLGAPTVRRRPDQGWNLSWRGRIVDDLNRIEVNVSEQEGALASFYGSDRVHVRGVSSERRLRPMTLLTIASSDYPHLPSGSRGGFGKLEFPVKDATDLLEQLRRTEQQRRAEYRLQHVVQLKDQEINPTTVQAAIDKVNRAAEANQDSEQLLVIHLAGHGTTIDGEFYYVPPAAAAGDEQSIREHGISWRLLRQAGTENVRVIYLIDTCRSGAAVDAKSSIRDPQRSLGLVFAATTGEKDALEDPRLQNGLFTYAVKQGIAGKADTESDSPNGVVDVDKLVSFVESLVLALSAGSQRPTATPLDLFELVSLPLARVE